MKTRWRKAILALLTVAGLWLGWSVYHHNPPTRVKNRAQALIEQIERLKDLQGRYPLVLAPALRAQLESIHSRVEYHSDGDSFGLYFGDYNHDGYWMAWTSAEDGWTVDE